MDVNFNIEDFILTGTISYYDLNSQVFIKIGKNIFMSDKLNLHTINEKLCMKKLNNDILILLYKYLNTYNVNKIVLTIKENVGQIVYKDTFIYLTLGLNVLDLLVDTLSDLDNIPKITIICDDEEKEKLASNYLSSLYNKKLKLIK